MKPTKETEQMMANSKEVTNAVNREAIDWDSINWPKHEQIVNRLQVRIVKAEKRGQAGKVKALQGVLTHSFSGKVLAVERVTSNKGKNTPGVDGRLWKHNRSKEMAVKDLTKRGYQPLPLRRVLIPKSNGKMRPLSIPTMKDRAMQALYLMALDPIAECRADPNSYGFRKARSCADAIEQCHKALAPRTASEWILEGDIKACFDKISHPWIMEHVPMDKTVLQKWLKAGYLYKNAFYNSDEGVPQGSIISPTLANIALDGLERKLEPWTSRGTTKGRKAKVHYVRYADDFIITGSSKELLENEIKPVVTAFFAERGLELSSEKTVITHIGNGFDFLGQNVRDYDGKILVKPSKKSVHKFLEKIRTVIKGNKAASANNLILQLNPIIQGWVNYHKHASSKKTFAQIDTAIFRALWAWAKRRHPEKGRKWVAEKYFGTLGNRSWRFFGGTRKAKGEPVTRNWLKIAAHTKIVRHVKIRQNVNPYDPADATYFAYRKAMQKQGRLAKPPDGYELDDADQLVEFLNQKDQVTEAASRLATRGV
jgi:RNA-directed DNA polymerase